MNDDVNVTRKLFAGSGGNEFYSGIDRNTSTLLN